MIELYYFTKSYCTDCKVQSKILKELDYKITEHDADSSLAKFYSIQKVPTIIVLKQDIEEHRFCGLKPISLIQKKIDMI